MGRWLDRLKNGARPRPHATKPTKPGFVGFVAPVLAPVEKIREASNPPDAPATTLVTTDGLKAEDATENEPEKRPAPALTEPPKPSSVGFGSTTPPPSQTILPSAGLDQGLTQRQLGGLKNPNTPRPHATKPTKPGFVGFVAPVLAPSQKIEAGEAVNDATAATDPDRWCWPHSIAMNSLEIETFMARVEALKSSGIGEVEAEAQADQLMRRDRLASTVAAGAGSPILVGAAPQGTQTILQRQEEAAWTWLRQYLQWDTVPITAIRGDAKANGVPWYVLLRIAGERIIVSRCGGYWKLPKPPKWTPDSPVD